MIRVRCPVCNRLMDGQSSSEWLQFPFCSSRCRLIDLGRWLGEDYRVPELETEGPGPASDEPTNP